MFPGVTWRNVFNTTFRSWGFSNNAQEAALDAGYPFTLWNGAIYTTADWQYLCEVKDMKNVGVYAV